MRRPIRQRGSAMSRKHGGEVSSGKAFSRNFAQTAFYEVRYPACDTSKSNGPPCLLVEWWPC
jgi:hypothetical protein